MEFLSSFVEKYNWCTKWVRKKILHFINYYFLLKFFFLSLGNDVLAARNQTRKFTTRTDCFQKCEDPELTKGGKDGKKVGHYSIHWLPIPTYIMCDYAQQHDSGIMQFTTLFYRRTS